MRKLLYIIAFGLVIIACSKKSSDPSPSNNGASNPVDTSHGGDTTHHVGTPIPVTLRIFRDNDEIFVNGGSLIYFNVKGQSQTGLLEPQTRNGTFARCSTTADASYNLYQDSTYVFEYLITNSSHVTEMQLDIQVKITAADIAMGCSYIVFNGFNGNKYIESSLNPANLKVNVIGSLPPYFDNGKFWTDQGMTQVTYPTF